MRKCCCLLFVSKPTQTNRRNDVCKNTCYTKTTRIPPLGLLSNTPPTTPHHYSDDAPPSLRTANGNSTELFIFSVQQKKNPTLRERTSCTHSTTIHFHEISSVQGKTQCIIEKNAQSFYQINKLMQGFFSSGGLKYSHLLS